MKVRIDPNIPDLTADEIEEIKDADIKRSEDDPAEFKRQMLGAKTVVMSEQVAKQLAEMGMTPDDVVALMLKKLGASN